MLLVYILLRTISGRGSSVTIAGRRSSVRIRCVYRSVVEPSERYTCRGAEKTTRAYHPSTVRRRGRRGASYFGGHCPQSVSRRTDLEIRYSRMSSSSVRDNYDAIVAGQTAGIVLLSPTSEGAFDGPGPNSAGALRCSELKCSRPRLEIAVHVGWHRCTPEQLGSYSSCWLKQSQAVTAVVGTSSGRSRLPVNAGLCYVSGLFSSSVPEGISRSP